MFPDGLVGGFRQIFREFVRCHVVWFVEIRADGQSGNIGADTQLDLSYPLHIDALGRASSFYRFIINKKDIFRLMLRDLNIIFLLSRFFLPHTSAHALSQCKSYLSLPGMGKVRPC